MAKEKVFCAVCGSRNYFKRLSDEVELDEVGEIYPDYCPSAEMLENLERAGILQECAVCGYTFTRVDEDMDVGKKFVKSKGYLYPFGEDFSGNEQAVKCIRAAMACQRGGCLRSAGKWYLYGALCVLTAKRAQGPAGNAEIQAERDKTQAPAENAEIQAEKDRIQAEKYLRQSWKYLERDMRDILKVPVSQRTEVILAYLNVSRLLGYFEDVKSQGESLGKTMKIYTCMQYNRLGFLDRSLLEVLVKLAEEKNRDYLTYSQMLEWKEGR